MLATTEVLGMPVLSALRGEVASRYLVQFRVGVEPLRALLPATLEPLELRGSALASVAWTRLSHPPRRWLPLPLAETSDLLSWRFCVAVRGRSGARPGVWIPRRDSSGGLAAQLASRLAPGMLERAHFEVEEHDTQLELRVRDDEGPVFELDAEQAGQLRGSLFASLRELQEFLNSLALVRPNDGYFAELDTPRAGGRSWCAQALNLKHCHAPWLAQCFADSMEVDSVVRLAPVRDALERPGAIERARLALRGHGAQGVPAL